MNIKLLFLLLALSETALGGGASTGGTPPSKTRPMEMHVGSREFGRIAIDLLHDNAILLNGETLVPRHLDFKERSIELESLTLPETSVIIRGSEAETYFEGVR